jgi:hypothetical protein
MNKYPMNPSSLLESYLNLFDRIYTVLLNENEWMETHGTLPEASVFEEKSIMYQELEKAMDSFVYFKNKPNLDNKSQSLMKQMQNKLMQLMMLNQDNEAAVLRIQLKQEREQHALRPISTRRASAVYQAL